MKKLSIVPSRSLCYDLGKHKCQNGCCADTQQYIKLRQFTQGQVYEKQQVFKSQLQLCNLTERKFCGNSCCMIGDCQYPSKPQGNLELQDLKCDIDNPSSQQLCRGAGLLWCDGQCCGFIASKHKCFSKNHFGIPYIRCPIQAKPTDDL